MSASDFPVTIQRDIPRQAPAPAVESFIDDEAIESNGEESGEEQTEGEGDSIKADEEDLTENDEVEEVEGEGQIADEGEDQDGDEQMDEVDDSVIPPIAQLEDTEVDDGMDVDELESEAGPAPPPTRVSTRQPARLTLRPPVDPTREWRDKAKRFEKENARLRAELSGKDIDLHLLRGAVDRLEKALKKSNK